MTKRRTKKQKSKAKRNLYQLYYQDTNETNDLKLNVPVVKGQLKTKPAPTRSKKMEAKNALSSENYLDLASIKKDLVKSIFFASFILCLEAMLYFIW